MRSLDAQQLRSFVLTVARHLLGAQPDSATLLRSIEESVATTDSLRGLREAARDMVEWSQDLHGDRLEELDRQLVAEGLPTLTQMRAA